MKSMTRLLAILGIISGLVACGGGGGGSQKDLKISTSAIELYAADNGTNPVQSYEISWSRPDVAGFVIGYPPSASQPGWLNIQAFGNTSPVTMQVTANISGLTPGVYSTTIRIISGTINYDPIDTIDIPFTLTVVEQLQLSNASARFQMTEGEVTNTIQATRITSGTNAITPTQVTIPTGATWLQATINSDQVEFSTTTNSTALAAGVYNANVSLIHQYGETLYPVSLRVNTPGVNHIAPYIATENTANDAIIRGHGFASLSNPTVRFESTPALSANVISDSEIHVRYPALAAGRYTVVVEDASTTLASSAELVSVTPPSFAYTSFSRTGNVAEVIYDAERSALYVSDATGNKLERYQFNGTNWLSTTLNYSSGTSLYDDIAMSTDGKKIVKTNFADLTVFDLDSFSVDATVSMFSVSSFPAPRFVDFINDGRVLISSSGDYNLYAYDLSTQSFEILSDDFSYANRFLSASADGSRVFMPSLSISILNNDPVSYFDASSDALVTVSQTTSHLQQISVDTKASRIILTDALNDQATVYDSAYNILGVLPPVDGLDIFFTKVSHAVSPDGARAYVYIGDTGMLHTLDLTTSDGSNGFAEVGMPLSIADGVSTFTRMRITPDGSTLFIVSETNVVVQPVP